MTDFFKSKNIEKESRISIVLNTFMYVDRCPEIPVNQVKNFGQAVSELCSEECLSELNLSQKGALLILKEYLERPENEDIASMKIVNYSEHMGNDYTGAYAASFVNNDRTEVYVVFRGTGVGRWYDNGDALARVCSPYQKTAEKYFNHTFARINPAENAELIVTGHSKGGNLAQYVTLVSPHRERITKCISFDGEGFSPEFLYSLGVTTDIARLNSINQAYVPYSIPEEARKQIYKMYSVCGDNDFVNVLGIKIIPADATVYIATDCAVTDVVASHAISPDYDDAFVNGRIKFTRNKYFFNWDTNSFNSQTDERRALAEIFRNVSSYIMNEAQEIREKDCHAVMDALEAVMSKRNTGLSGENAAAEEYMELIKALPSIFLIAETTAIESLIPKKQKNIIKKQISLFKAAAEIISDSIKNKK